MFNWINCTRLFSWLPISSSYDKVCHFVAGLIISAVAAFFGGVMIGLAAGFIAGLGKEAYDQYSENGSGANFFDFFSTLLGTVIGSILTVEILKFFI